MQCISCQSDIDPRWKHAIEINVCPLCGNPVVETHLKELLTVLRETMDKLQQYPDQLNDWLLSNYHYIKTDSPALLSHVPKEQLKEVKTEQPKQVQDGGTVMKIKLRDGTETDVIVEKIASDDKAKEFFDRANPVGKSVKGKVLPGQEAPKSIQERTQHFKNIKQKIEQEAAQGIVSQASLADMIEADNAGIVQNSNAEVSAEEISLMQAQLTGGGLASGMPEMPDDNGMEPIPNVVLAMAGSAANANPAVVKAKELQYLEQQKNAVANAQKRMGSGSFGRHGG